MRRLVLVALIAIGIRGTSLAQTAYTTTLDGTAGLTVKVVGDQLWTIRAEANGAVSGIATHRVTGATSFVWCQRTSSNGVQTGLYCFVRDACTSQPCDESWKVVGELVVPASIVTGPGEPVPPPALPHRSLDDLLGRWRFSTQDILPCFDKVTRDEIAATVDLPRPGGNGVAGTVRYQPMTLFGQSYDYAFAYPSDVSGQTQFFLFNRWSADSIGGLSFIVQDDPRSDFIINRTRHPFVSTRAGACPTPR